MQTLSRRGSITVPYPPGAEFNWDNIGNNDYIDEIYGVPIYADTSNQTFYVMPNELEDKLFSDTYNGSMLSKMLDLGLTFDRGVGPMVLSYVLRYGNGGHNEIVQKVRDAVHDSIQLGLVAPIQKLQDGFCYRIYDYFFMYDSSRKGRSLFIVNLHDSTRFEFR